MIKKPFKLVSEFSPAGDQGNAIESLVDGIKKNYRFQTVLGATGTGKTFVMAKVIEAIQRPTLVLVHNKTLAAQLYSEFKDFFPENAVHYFVSYYDYYQPEAYIPKTDTYIAKDASINEEIDRLRNAATMSLMTREDCLIVASVSAIYGLGSPKNYLNLSFDIKVGERIPISEIARKLVDIQYKRNDTVLERGGFSVTGDSITIYPSYEEYSAFRIEFFGDEIEKIFEVDTLTGDFLEEISELKIFPAKHYTTEKSEIDRIIPEIRKELDEWVLELKKRGKELEAQRIKERTEYDLEMLKEIGHVQGIENYTRYLENLKPGEPSPTLIDYFPEGFLTFIDESHITVPQIGGMYGGNLSRKDNLVNYGFRLPSSYDNRPLKFDEFLERIGKTIFVSATPGEFELKNSQQVVDLVVRPTGLLDPEIEIHPTENQIDHLIGEIQKRIGKGQRVLVTTLTKKMSEQLSSYLKEIGIKVQYLHSEIETIERVEILRDLRLGKYDVVVGINLLREGLDLPEVSLVAILDADKEGFLRSKTSLIQTIGRAARNVDGKVIMYADRITDSMKGAIEETERRRKKQIEYNKKHEITPQTIVKAIRELTESQRKEASRKKKESLSLKSTRKSKDDIKKIIDELEDKMSLAAMNLEFEKAAELRDQIEELREIIGE